MTRNRTAPTRALTKRELNRALLARQMLLRRHEMPAEEVVARGRKLIEEARRLLTFVLPDVDDRDVRIAKAQ